MCQAANTHERVSDIQTVYQMQGQTNLTCQLAQLIGTSGGSQDLSSPQGPSVLSLCILGFLQLQQEAMRQAAVVLSKNHTALRDRRRSSQTSGCLLPDTQAVPLGALNLWSQEQGLQLHPIERAQAMLEQASSRQAILKLCAQSLTWGQGKACSWEGCKPLLRCILGQALWQRSSLEVLLVIETHRWVMGYSIKPPLPDKTGEWLYHEYLSIFWPILQSLGRWSCSKGESRAEHVKLRIKCHCVMRMLTCK